MLRQDDVEPYLYAQAELEAYAQQQAIPEAAMLLLGGGPEELSISGMQRVTNGLRLTVSYPASFSGQVWSVYQFNNPACVVTNAPGGGGGGTPPPPDGTNGVPCTNCVGCVIDLTNSFKGLESAWTLAFNNLVLTGETATSWTDTQPLGSDTNGNPVHRFYGAGSNADSDQDQLSSGYELFISHTDALNQDSDGDGLDDGAELLAGTNPLNLDTDGDGFLDGYEVGQNTDPLSFTNTPALYMVINNDDPYTRSTNLTIRFPGFVTSGLLLDEAADLSNAVYKTYTEPVSHALNGTSNGVRTLYAQLFWGSQQTLVIAGRIIYDDGLPMLANLSPTNQHRTNRRWIKLTGDVADELSPVRVFVNGEWADGVTSSTFWHDRIPLLPGTNLFSVRVEDRAGNSATQQVEIIQDATGDTNAPGLSLALPGLSAIGPGPTAVYGDEEVLYVQGVTDDETAQVLIFSGSNRVNEAVVAGTQLWGSVRLEPGSNQLLVVARDAALNSNVLACTVVRDTSYVFRITSPKAYQVMNAPSATVSGVASPMFLNATITVNGVATTLTNQGDHVTFATVTPVPLLVGRTELVGEARQGGQVYYTDPPPVGYEVQRVTWRDVDVYQRQSAQPCTLIPPYNDQTLATTLYHAVWSHTGRVLRSVTLQNSCWYGHLYPCYFPPVWSCTPNSNELSRAMDVPTNRLVFGRLDTEYLAPSVALPNFERTSRVYDGSALTIRVVREGASAQHNIIQFPGLRVLGEGLVYVTEPEQVAARLTFRGRPGFVYNGLVSFLVELKPDTDYTISREDFGWAAVETIQSGIAGRPVRTTAQVLDFEPMVRTDVLKIEMGMDGNRDDTIDFDNPDDAKYLFWVNDDVDVISGGEEDDADSGTANCNDSVITCRRDLEDFTRLHVRVDDNTANLSGITYWLKFDNVSAGSPALNLFEAVDTSLDYLTSQSVSGQQIAKVKLLEISSTEQVLPTQYIKTGNQRSAFLVEGKAAGKGDLVLVIKKDGVEICRKAVQVDLRLIEEFYQKYVVTISTDDEVNPTSTAVGSYTYSPENDEYLLHVHGWNMENWEKDRWTETVFKRLWWQRYKGHVGGFQWPTLGTLYYDRSEFRAWRSAQALSHRITVLNSTYSGEIRVLAHSMGNVVMGEALRQLSAGQVHTYIAAQAAIPAHCYDNAVANYWTGFSTPNVYGFYFSGVAPSVPYLNGNSAKAGSMAQYFNALDFALGAWQLNNELKPDLNYHYTEGDANVDTYNTGGGDRFYYDSLVPLDERDLVFQADRYEIFARCAESRARALGREGTVAGFGIFRNLQLWGYDGQHYSHSREFRSNIVAEWPFWSSVIQDGNFSQ